jgi:sarcosine oxidase
MMLRKHLEVIVAGLGAAGSAVLLHLADRGVRALGLDRFTPPHTLGSSHGLTRVIREAYFEHPGYVPLVQRSFALWRALEERTGRALLHTTGAVTLGADGSEAVQGALRSAREHGIPYERLEAAQIRARFFALEPGPGVVGVWEPHAGALAVEACVQAHLDAARAGGAEVRFEEPVLGWREDGAGVEVETPRGRYVAGSLVLAAGAWMPGLVPSLPLQVERQVQCWFDTVGDPALLRPGRFPVFLWQQDDGSMFYGLPDLGDGVKVARHRGGERTTPAGVRRAVDLADVAEVRRFLADRIPVAAGPLRASSVCLYTNTPDHHFLIDRHPEQPGVWLVSPCSGHGFKFAPVVGERVAEWVVSGSPPPDLAPFRFRFGA